MKIFKVWARIEVMDTETEEHEDLNPEQCEYKVGEFASLEETAAFLDSFEFTYPHVLKELETEMEYQFGGGASEGETTSQCPECGTRVEEDR